MAFEPAPTREIRDQAMSHEMREPGTLQPIGWFSIRPNQNPRQ